MQGWQTSYLGLRDVPVEISECEPQAFFSFSRAELELIARRRSDCLKLGLALHVGFVRMSELPLNSVGAVPPALLATLAANSTSPRPTWFRCERCTPAGAPCSTTGSKPVNALASNG